MCKSIVPSYELKEEESVPYVSPSTVPITQIYDSGQIKSLKEHTQIPDNTC
jgi:hypothetical protein